jgi:FMN phosphatase YigB (HAD superfamily)
MPFVKRDETGRIVALFRERSDEAPEYLAANSPEIAEFSDPDATRGERGNMLQSDLEMIRVYEDLIDILISKRIVVLTDFPTKAQEKLVRRKRLRSSLSSLTDVLAPEDDDGEEEALP